MGNKANGQCSDDGNQRAAKTADRARRVCCRRQRLKQAPIRWRDSSGFRLEGLGDGVFGSHLHGASPPNQHPVHRVDAAASMGRCLLQRSGSIRPRKVFQLARRGSVSVVSDRRRRIRRSTSRGGVSRGHPPTLRGSSSDCGAIGNRRRDTDFLTSEATHQTSRPPKRIGVQLSTPERVAGDRQARHLQRSVRPFLRGDPNVHQRTGQDGARARATCKPRCLQCSPVCHAQQNHANT